MARSDEPKIVNFRTDYASRADFCEVLERDLKPLYLLAFLLTADHNKAEQCFIATVEQALDRPAVFKEFARSWIKRSLINRAIGVVCPTSASSTEIRDLWTTRESSAGGEDEINAVTQFPPLERFVFVMSILESYSDWECSLLIGCTTKDVAEARRRALRKISGSVGLIPRVEPQGSRFVGIPA
jgi:DNA-directed RNA polymerase specialized sigma24 family protein